VYPDAPIGWVFPGDPGIPKTLAPTDYKNFGPRVGFAYSPGFSDGILGKIFGGPGKTSIRTAFGMYYTAVEDLTLFFEVGDAPFGLFYVSPTQVYLEEPYKARTNGLDPGQRFPFSIPKPGATGIWPQYRPISSSPGFKTDNVLPYAEHFNFSIQREFGDSAILTLAYVGTRGHHLIAQTSFNPGNPALCLATPGCGPCGEDVPYDIKGDQMFTPGVDVFGTRPFSVTSGRYLDPLNPLLDFANNNYSTTVANSNYNSLQISLERRVGRMRFLGAYTWSKSLDDASGFADNINPYNRAVSKALSSFDLAHNFVVSYTYDLPFEKLTGSSSGVARKFLEGWRITAITRFTTGLPISMGESVDYSLCGCGGADRPNYTGAPIQISEPRSSPDNQCFSAAPFFSEGGLDPDNNPILGVAGNANRRIFHGPGLNNWDLSVHKSTRITEKTSIEFRAEFFNFFNHAQFRNPSGNFSSGNFGKVTGARDPRIGQLALKFNF